MSVKIHGQRNSKTNRRMGSMLNRVYWIVWRGVNSCIFLFTRYIQTLEHYSKLMWMVGVFRANFRIKLRSVFFVLASSSSSIVVDGKARLMLLSFTLIVVAVAVVVVVVCLLLPSWLLQVLWLLPSASSFRTCATKSHFKYSFPDRKNRLSNQVIARGGNSLQCIFFFFNILSEQSKLQWTSWYSCDGSGPRSSIWRSIRRLENKVEQIWSYVFATLAQLVLGPPKNRGDCWEGRALGQRETRSTLESSRHTGAADEFIGSVSQCRQASDISLWNSSLRQTQSES